jgi:hypothetical protein
MRARIHSESHLFSHTRGRLTLSTVIVACIVLLLLSTVCIAGVKWKANGVTVCAEKGLQTGPRIASDGAGGAIITWEDQRSTSAGDIYAQRVNSSGVPQWTAGGVRISKTAGTHLYPQIVSDGAKGAIITWDDYGLGYRAIFAQRVNSSGAKQWAAIGVQVAEAGAGGSAEPAEWGSRVTSDGKNGAMITWMRLVGSPRR